MALVTSVELADRCCRDIIPWENSRGIGMVYLTVRQVSRTLLWMGLVPLLRSAVLDRGEDALDPGVGHCDVEAIIALDSVVDPCIDMRSIGDVAG